MYIVQMLIVLDVDFGDTITVVNLIANLVDVTAIVITGGWCNPGIGAANLLDILDYLKCKSIPVFVGSLTVINRESVKIPSLYYIDTLWNTMQYIPRKKHALPVPGTDYVEYIRGLDHTVDVVCLTAFTDVMPLLELDNIGQIYALGANIPADVTDPISDTKHSNAQAEIYNDPQSAQDILARAHSKIHWLDVSVSRAIPVNETTVANVRRVFKGKYGKSYSKSLKGRACFFIYKLLKNMVRTDYTNEIYIWDYVIALTALCPHLFKTAKVRALINAEQSSELVRTDTHTTITKVYSNNLGEFTKLPLDSPIGYLTNYIDEGDESAIRDTFVASL